MTTETMQQRVTDLVQAIGADIKILAAAEGNLSALTTTAKSDLVSAINEVNGLVGTNQTNFTQQLNQLRSDILGGADPAYQTIKEIEDFLKNDDNAISGILASIATKVSFTELQSTTQPQKLIACTNIGVGDPNHDFVADYMAAKA